MISERTLKKWRKDALKNMEVDTIDMYKDTTGNVVFTYLENLKCILRMTQELLDLHLIRK